MTKTMTTKQFKTYLDKNSSVDARYIRLENEKFEFEPLEFEKKHIDMVKGRHIISAGFISVRPKVVNVTGSSKTTDLDIDRSSEDTKLLGVLLDRNAGSYS